MGINGPGKDVCSVSAAGLSSGERRLSGTDGCHHNAPLDARLCGLTSCRPTRRLSQDPQLASPPPAPGKMFNEATSARLWGSFSRVPDQATRRKVCSTPATCWPHAKELTGSRALQRT